jgi:hypothetical protein
MTTLRDSQFVLAVAYNLPTPLRTHRRRLLKIAATLDAVENAAVSPEALQPNSREEITVTPQKRPEEAPKDRE